MLRKKFDALDTLKNFNVIIEVEKSQRIECLKSNEGGEFESIEFSIFCELNGIKK